MFKKLRIFGRAEIFKIFNRFSTIRTLAEKTKVRRLLPNLHKSATEEEIKITYRSLAKRFHPDVNVGVETHEKYVDKI